MPDATPVPAPVVEAPPPKPAPDGKPSPVVEQPRDPQSGRFAALAAKEKALVAKQREASLKEAALKEREAKIAEFETRKAGWKKNPKALLEDGGVTYEELTAHLLGEKQSPEQAVEALRKEIADKEAARQTALDKAEEERRARLTEEEKEARAAFAVECEAFVNTNAEAYELTKLYGQSNLIPAVIEEHHTRTKKLLSMKEAADLVEQHLEAETLKAAASKKIAAKLKAAPASAPQRELATPRPTLTNRMTESTHAPTPAQTDDERMARALAAMERAQAAKQ